MIISMHQRWKIPMFITAQYDRRRPTSFIDRWKTKRMQRLKSYYLEHVKITLPENASDLLVWLNLCNDYHSSPWYETWVVDGMVVFQRPLHAFESCDMLIHSQTGHGPVRPPLKDCLWRFPSRSDDVGCKTAFQDCLVNREQTSDIPFQGRVVWFSCSRYQMLKWISLQAEDPEIWWYGLPLGRHVEHGGDLMIFKIDGSIRVLLWLPA